MWLQACLAISVGDSGLRLYQNSELFWIIRIIKFWIILEEEKNDYT